MKNIERHLVLMVVLGNETPDLITVAGIKKNTKKGF